MLETRKPSGGGGSRREGTHLIVGCGEAATCLTNIFFFFSISSFVIEALISSWDHGCLEWKLYFPASLAAHSHMTKPWPMRCKQKWKPQFRDASTALCPLTFPAPFLHLDAESGHGWLALSGICGSI